MSEDKAKILDKIKKLFRLGDANSGGTEAEIELAVTRAREMMARHNISLAELKLMGDDEESKTIAWNIEQSTAYTRKIRDLAQYDYYVCTAVNELTHTRSFVQHTFDGYTKLVFVGEATDVAVAIELFTILLQSVRKFTRRRYGSDKWTIQHTSYALGFGLRLIHRAKEMMAMSARETECVALVLRSKDTAIDEFYAKLNLAQAKPRKIRLDAAAHSQGYVDGAKLSLQKDRIVR